MVVIGLGLHGRCDFVPGRFHVATRFFTVFFLPVLPLQGLIVLEETAGRATGIPIPIGVRSLLLAWLRGGLCGGGLVLTAVGLIGVVDHFNSSMPRPLPESILFLCGGVVLLAAGVASLRVFAHAASFDRAVQLALAANVDPAQISAQYRQPIPSADALERLKRGITPVNEAGKPAFGPVGNTISNLIGGGVGALLLLWGGDNLLHYGFRGWGTSFFWAAPTSIGLLLLLMIVAALLKLSARITDCFMLAGVATFFFGGGLGPWLSAWVR